jgi:hypothetical protein
MPQDTPVDSGSQPRDGGMNKLVTTIYNELSTNKVHNTLLYCIWFFNITTRFWD